MLRAHNLRLSILFAFVGVTGCGTSAEESEISTSAEDGGADAATSTSTEDGSALVQDGGVTIDSGVFVAGDPLTAPAKEQWTWVDFPESKCANGKPTGVGVNLTDKSKRALIFLEGGGACWDELTCFTFKTAANIESGYGSDQLTQDSNSTLGAGLFNRADLNNPYKDYNFVYLPYCTGDVHSGDSTAVYGARPQVEHHGLKNVQAFLKRIVPTFTGADRVILAGRSAGGFGAMYHWWRVQEAFGKTRVDLVDDSGTMLPDPYLPAAREATWRTAWNLEAGLPKDCTTCGALSGLFDYYATNFPNQRMALLSYQRDTTLAQFFGPISLDKFGEGLVSLLATKMQHQNMRYYIAAGDGHVLSGNNGIQTKGVRLYAWLNQMATDDSTWANATP